MSEQQAPTVERKPRAKGVSPNAKTLAYFRELGFFAETVERRLPIPGKFVTQDFAGIIDIIAFREGVGIVGIQTTSGANHAARRKKALDLPSLRKWLAAGGKFEIVSWAKVGGRGEVKRWAARREEITLEAFA